MARAPSAANRWQSARPMPFAPPVTTATLSLSFIYPLLVRAALRGRPSPRFDHAFDERGGHGGPPLHGLFVFLQLKLRDRFTMNFVWAIR
jgi:hypothetical protein